MEEAKQEEMILKYFKFFQFNLRCILDFELSRDRALSFFWDSRFREEVSRCIPHKWWFYCDTCRIQTHNPSFMSSHA